MKHLQTFENFTEEERESYDKIASSKEELENSTSFSEMSEKEQEVLSDAYSKESESISDDMNEQYCQNIKGFKEYVIYEMDCNHLVDNPLAPEVEYSECTSAMTFDDVMKPFVRKIKWISSQAGEAYSLNSFLTRWLEEYKDFQERVKDISL